MPPGGMPGGKPMYGISEGSNEIATPTRRRRWARNDMGGRKRLALRQEPEGEG